MPDNLETLFSFISNDEVRLKLQASEDRIRRSFNQLFSGYGRTAEDVLNEVVKVSAYTGIVRISRINFYSHCEHHFAPFFGQAAVWYEPGEIITGLGKIVRLVRDVHAPRLQIQETMTRDIAEDIKRVLHAKGALVATDARHLCICSRGPNDDTAMTRVVYGCGSLEMSAKELADVEGRGSPEA